MKVVSQVSVEGYFVEDVLVPDGKPLPEGCIESRPPEGLHLPRWNGSAWEEGKPTSELVEARKPQKIAEMHAAALDELSPLFTDQRGNDELALVLAAHVKRICEALGVEADPRLSEVERVGEKALAKRDEIEAATTPEEVEAVEWEGPA